MEANEVQELKENAEHGSNESELRPVAFTMSVLAVLVAVMTVLGHRTHTEAVLDQNRATDQWNQYQAQKIRSDIHNRVADLLSAVTIAHQDKADEITKDNVDHQAKWKNDLKEDQEKADGLQVKVEQAEARADRFDLSEALLEIGLVITSVTLLTRSRWYWYLGILFSICGIASALSVLTLK
jgi:Na+-transporting methylmalonyl-CoA/oxaloacetate decarboxylase gamma subunit